MNAPTTGRPFRDLPTGARFDFINPARPHADAFTAPCEKISARLYAWTDSRTGSRLRTQIGTIDCPVYHVRPPAQPLTGTEASGRIRLARLTVPAPIHRYTLETPTGRQILQSGGCAPEHVTYLASVPAPHRAGAPLHTLTRRDAAARLAAARRAGWPIHRETFPARRPQTPEETER